MRVSAGENRARRWVLAAACSSLAAALGGVLWLSFQEPHGPTRTLPDGTRLELSGVTHGKHHVHWDGNWWRRILPPEPPFTLTFTRPGLAGLMNRPESPRVETDTSTEAVVLWFRTRFGSNPWSGSWSAVTVDGHGCKMRCLGEGWSSVPPGSIVDWRHPTTGSIPMELQVYPRREARFHYGLVSHRNSPRVEFVIHNPVPAHPKEWVGHPCPVVAQAGSTRFVLRRLAHTPTGGPFSQATAAFQYFEDGRAVNNWRPDLVTLLDSSGNVLETRQVDFTQDHSATFDALCQFESAWKLRVRFRRVDPAAVAPDFVWKLRNLPAPPRNRHSEPGKSAKLGDITLRLERLVGGGSVSWKQGSGTYQYPDVSLSVHAPEGAYLVSLVNCTDQAGRSLLESEPGPAAEVIGYPGQELSYSLKRYSTTTQKLNLTFAAHRTRTVEFMVKPMGSGKSEGLRKEP